MQKTFILLHIREMNFRSKFVEISDHVSKLIFYANQRQKLILTLIRQTPYILVQKEKHKLFFFNLKLTFQSTSRARPSGHFP